MYVWLKFPFEIFFVSSGLDWIGLGWLMEWLDWVYIYMPFFALVLFCFGFRSCPRIDRSIIISDAVSSSLFSWPPLSHSLSSTPMSPKLPSLNPIHPLPSRGKKCRLRKCPLLQPSPIPLFSFLVVIYISISCVDPVHH